MNAQKTLFCLLYLTSLPGLAAEKQDPLDTFLSGLSTFSANFVQIVLDGQGSELEKSGGVLYLSQPGKFHWAYREPYLQKIIADGQSIWIYDEDLEQITVNSARASIGKTPAAVLLGDVSIDEHFFRTDSGKADGYDWIELSPRDPESEYENIQIGFHDNQLGLMLIHDSLGQMTRIQFSESERNKKLDEALFTLDIPEGVDVIDNRDSS